MPTDPRAARHTLREAAQQTIERALQSVQETARAARPRVLWWDDGGHLEGELRAACQRIGIGFTAAEDHPLSLRALALEETAERALWYVPEARGDCDWFRDVRAAGDGAEVTDSLFDLAARLYGASPWQLFPREADASDARHVEILLDELTSTPLPSFQELRTKLLTQGARRAEEALLRDGWTSLSRDAETVQGIRDLLGEAGVPDLSADDGPEALVRKTRRWAVAGWLVREGLPASALPGGDAYAATSDFAFRRLKAALQRPGAAAPVHTFLATDYWPDALAQTSDPWSLAACPVDGALDRRLWQAWLQDFEGEAFEDCAARAEERANALRKAYCAASVEAAPWVQAWEQAANLAGLARRYATWEDRIGTVSLPVLYGDDQRGTWHIDRAVRRIIVSGAPEAILPGGHPAERLGGIRQRLAQDQYVRYLRRLGEEMERTLKEQTLFESSDLRQSYRFWAEHKETLATGNEAILYYLDALRLDLARELAAQLQERGCEVQASLWMSALPSETEFGMGALLPGQPRSYEVRLRDGSLIARQGARQLTTAFRQKRLESEGWAVTTETESGAWSSPRVAYFDSEFDKIGENDLSEIERHLAGRVERLAGLITRQLRQGDWFTAYVVTDHGFVLLPEGASLEAIAPPDEAQDVKRRRVAGEALPADGNGVLLDSSRVPALGYLSSPVRLLTDSQQRFRKQGITDARFYHGGASAQECILCFLEITRA